MTQEEEEVEGESLLEALGDFDAGERDLQGLLQAQGELESRILPEAQVAAEDEPAGSGGWWGYP